MFAYQIKSKLQELCNELAYEASYYTYNGYYRYNSEEAILKEINDILEQLFVDEYAELNIKPV